jgi:hypothetical protein
MVVSFIIVVPFSLGRLVGGLSPLPRTLLPRSDTASRISFEDFLLRRLKRSEVAAPAQLLFEVYTDVERWPVWTAWMARGPGIITTGSHVVTAAAGGGGQSHRITGTSRAAADG